MSAVNCLAVRRNLLAAPRERSAGSDAHLAECRECRRLAGDVIDLDNRIAEAALIAVPDALADRVLLGHRRQRRWPHVAAAASVLAAVTLGFAAAPVWKSSTPALVAAVGPSHPAVSAIAMVVEQQPAYLDEARSIDFASIERALERLGLSLDKQGVRIDFAGRCYMPDTECDHLVLDTPDGRVSVILVPEYPVGPSARVAHRHMTAIVSPAGSGGYIVVAESAEAAQRVQKRLIKG